MKIFLLIALTANLLFGYQKGDTIDTDIQKHLELQEGKLYIVDFFASWCGSCKKEIPLIAKANKKLDPKNVEIIGIDVDKDIKKGKAFQEALRQSSSLNFRVIDDPMNLIIAKFEPIGMPALYYIRDGKVLDVVCGAVDNIDEQILLDAEKL